jgi:hypothetical protein
MVRVRVRVRVRARVKVRVRVGVAAHPPPPSPSWAPINLASCLAWVLARRLACGRTPLLTPPRTQDRADPSPAYPPVTLTLTPSHTHTLTP